MTVQFIYSIVLKRFYLKMSLNVKYIMLILLSIANINKAGHSVGSEDEHLPNHSGSGEGSNGPNCNLNGELYFIPEGSGHENWNNAQAVCNSCSSTLPIIRNKTEEEALFLFLSTRLNDLVWTAGEKEEQSSSRPWINGQHLVNPGSSDDSIYPNLDNLCHQDRPGVHCMAINASDGKLKSCHCNSHFHFVCERRAESTTELRTQPSFSTTTDITTYVELSSSSTTESTSKPSSSSETTPTTISTPSSSSKTQLTTTSKPPSSSYTTQAITLKPHSISTTKSTTTSKPFSRATIKSATTSQLPPSSESSIQAWKYAVPGIVIPVVIICIIIIVFFAIRNRRKSSKNLESLSGPEQHLESINKEGSFAKLEEKRNYGVYAEIPLETISNTEAVNAENSHPGIVYVSLDFGNSEENSNQAQANNTYPQGDLYAEVNKPKPDSKPAQSKVEPQGDIYAQVSHNTTQPSQQEPSGAVLDIL